jgi:hypothetical protein
LIDWLGMANPNDVDYLQDQVQSARHERKQTADIQTILTTVQVHSTTMGQRAGANLMARLFKLESPGGADDLGFSGVERASS